MKKKTYFNIVMALILLLLILPQTVQAATTNQISQFGITWTFDKDYEYGQFANGDYWVIGPVNITTITPGWDGQKHGSMVNPTLDFAYDSRLGGTGANRRDAPMTLQPNSSLVSTISWTPGEPGCPTLVNGIPRPLLKTAAVLTVLSSVPPDNSFRPPYAGSSKPIYLTTRLRKNLLPNLTRVYTSGEPNLITVQDQMQRVWLDHLNANGSIQYTSPSYNMPTYGRDYMQLIGLASCLLMLDETALQSVYGINKDTLLIRLVQIGIDLSAAVDNGATNWVSGGGALLCARKWPILFAGIMLDDSHMKGIGSGPATFLEDSQTLYIGDSDIYIPPYSLVYKVPTYSAGTVNVTDGSNVVNGNGTAWVGTAGVGYLTTFAVGGTGDDQAMSPTGRPYTVSDFDQATQTILLSAPYTGETESNHTYRLAYLVGYGHAQTNTATYMDLDEYTEAHRGLPEWINNGVGGSYGGFLTSDPLGAPAYRNSNSKYYPAYILAALIMGAKGLWNHDALFDYTDRWVAGQGSNTDSAWFGSTWAKNMWLAYRNNYGCVYNGLNTTTHQRIYDCAGEVVDCSLITTCADYSNQGARDCDPCNLGCGVSFLYGDVSEDAEISAYDAALTAQAAVDLITLTPEQFSAADVDGSKDISAYDAALIAQYSVGLISKFPVE